jgi:hypothetical protein
VVVRTTSTDFLTMNNMYNLVIERLNYPTETVEFEDLEIQDKLVSGRVEVKVYKSSVPYDGNLISGGYTEVDYKYEVIIDKIL